MRIGYIKGKLEKTLDDLVVALCRDFERRALALSSDSLSRRTRAEFSYLNYKITSAVAEVVPEDLVFIFIKEIGERRGYAASEIEGMSEGTYKSKKSTTKINIAKKLHFCD